MQNIARTRAPRGGAPAFLTEHLAYDRDECLLWPFGINSEGYGYVSIGGKNIGAYRHMCELANGPPPPDRPEAAHSCGNRRCVNPRHLRWASRAENHADMKAHGTSISGSKNGWSKLNEADVLEIRRALARGERSKAIGARFSISHYTVLDIKSGKRWGWLKSA